MNATYIIWSTHTEQVFTINKNATEKRAFKEILQESFSSVHPGIASAVVVGEKAKYP